MTDERIKQYQRLIERYKGMEEGGRLVPIVIVSATTPSDVPSHTRLDVDKGV